MKLTLTVCLILTAFANAEELNLNFQQHDYQLKFERLETVRYNKGLFQEFQISTFKYNRTLAVTNLTFIPRVDFDINSQTVVQVYKFMSNEYRHFPIRFAAKFCQFLSVNSGGVMDAFRRCGNILGCPFLKGRKYYACNVYPDASKFPPLIPNGQFKIELQMVQDSQEMCLIVAYVTVSRPLV